MENGTQVVAGQLPEGGREPFLTARQIMESGLFPDLTEEKIRHYVRQGQIRAYGPGKNKTYILMHLTQTPTTYSV
jgi:hypothetical protein